MLRINTITYENPLILYMKVFNVESVQKLLENAACLMFHSTCATTALSEKKSLQKYSFRPLRPINVILNWSVKR